MAGQLRLDTKSQSIRVQLTPIQEGKQSSPLARFHLVLITVMHNHSIELKQGKLMQIMIKTIILQIKNQTKILTDPSIIGQLQDNKVVSKLGIDKKNIIHKMKSRISFFQDQILTDIFLQVPKLQEGMRENTLKRKEITGLLLEFRAQREPSFNLSNLMY